MYFILFSILLFYFVGFLQMHKRNLHPVTYSTYSDDSDEGEYSQDLENNIYTRDRSPTRPDPSTMKKINF